MDESRASLLSLATLILVIVLTGVATVIYPEDWAWPIWLPALFGPFLAMRLGSVSATVFVFLCFLLIVPLLIRVNIWTIMLALSGICIWLFIGFLVGLAAYAT